MTSEQEKDGTWTAALDWLLRVRASPDDTALADDLRRWLARDVRHARAYRKAEKVWRLTGDVGPMHEPQRQPPITTQRAVGRRASRFAGIALALAASVLALTLGPSRWVLLRADYHTGTAQIERVTLDDGSAVEINAKSSLAVRYSAARREIELLSGEAFFDVTRDATRPFVVRSGKFAVTVKGTAFDVSRSEESLTVSVLRGSVWVSGPGTAPVTLQPGAQLRLKLHVDETPELSSVSPASISAWRQGRLIVDNAPAPEVIDELQRHIPGMVFVTGDALKSRRVTGIFDTREPRKALESVVRPFNGTVRTLTDYITIISSGDAD